MTPDGENTAAPRPRRCWPEPTGVVDHQPSAVVVTDDGGAVLYCNQRAADLVGSTPGEIRGRHLRDVGLAPADPKLRREIVATIGAEGSWEGDYDIERPGRDPIRLHTLLERVVDPERGFAGTIAIAVDMTGRENLSARIRDLAFTDQLTGLPNTVALVGEVEAAVAASQGRSHQVAVLAVDFDDFRLINDTLGHETGDQLIATAAGRLAEVVGSDGLLARRSGDGFLVCLPRVSGPDQAMTTATALQQSLAFPFRHGAGTVRLSATVGVAVSEEGDLDRKLMQEADIAMFEAKEAGKRRVLLFDDTLRRHRRRVRAVASTLEQAMQSDQIITLYQPVVALPSGDLVGFEALARWQHPDSGLMMPDQFIPVAEETGLIEALGARVLCDACRDVVTWPSAPGRPPLTMAVNVSGRQLQATDFVDVVRNALARSGLDPARLCLEITETDVGDTDSLAEGLGALRRLGVQLAIDDFGVGYSSLARLRSLPIDYLKIDRAFVATLVDDPGSWAIVGAIVNLATAMGLETIGEGVEEPAQADVLHKLGCRLGQGYNWSRPVPYDRATELVRAAIY